MRKYYAASLIALSLLGVSCNRFLDVKPKGVIIASNINDFDALLNSADLINNSSLVNPMMVTDDIVDVTFNPSNQQSASGNVYFWHPYINASAQSPSIWIDYYNAIVNMNVITEGVMQATSGTEQKKKQLYAEALVSKAFSYYQLLTFFSPGYGKGTAHQVYGVPYMTSTDISQPTPARPLLDDNLKLIIADLKRAVTDLEYVTPNNTRAGKSAAYALLSRYYLYMQEYQLAMDYADSVMKDERLYLLDYNNYLKTPLPNTTVSPEEIYVRYTNNQTYRYSADLLQQYDTATDLRIRLFAKRNTTGDTRILSFNNFLSYNPNRGITYAEILLNKAECLARLGDTDAALDIVNTIREMRFKPKDLQRLSANTAAEALTLVLVERRRELAMKGARWGDMKRLNQEGRMPAVNRVAADGITVLGTLKPGSLQYTFQIPLQVQAFNKDMPLNQQ
ncbi:SusD-like starch-binding protein associating with outer membrane [Chitinophaga dinghuensis]|uniref:SusD-like starch-binding protein associating with outer membrane n=1 Tax=Chitinophaga dinghuensis TaxID=1539050 RepID=A0A327W0U5_9BACT|nr:RagB/SusD family nutrient uptake outer membrane protein [Chitinophaga dinghuensis]RAJ81866.1 SusD-like starch-binding protein associating with outer membrane [Chitinophaga dinghuensis]